MRFHRLNKLYDSLSFVNECVQVELSYAMEICFHVNFTDAHVEKIVHAKYECLIDTVENCRSKYINTRDNHLQLICIGQCYIRRHWYKVVLSWSIDNLDLFINWKAYRECTVCM